MDVFARLNDKQTQAVKNTEGYVRVIAGVGSGKTKLLVSRYAYLVKEYGIDSANIDRKAIKIEAFRKIGKSKSKKPTGFFAESSKNNIASILEITLKQSKRNFIVSIISLGFSLSALVFLILHYFA